MTNTNLNWADSGSTDGEVCHKFSVNKVEQNFEQYVCPRVISRIRPDIADIKNTWISVVLFDSYHILILIHHDV